MSRSLRMAMCLSLAGCTATLHAQQAAPNRATVKGVLVGTDGSPLKGKTVFYVLRNDRGQTKLTMMFGYGVKKQGTLAASAETGADGSFAIELGSLEDDQEVELGLFEGGHRGHSLGKFKVGKVKLDGGKRTGDVGKIVWK